MLAIDIVRQLLQYQARYRSTDAAPRRPGKHPRVEEGSGEGDASSNWNSIPNVLKHMIGSHVPLESARMNLVEKDAADTIDYQPKIQGCAHPLPLEDLSKALSKFRTTINLQRCLPDDKQAVEEIAQVLRNGVVTTLDLSYNRLDAEAGKALADALSGNGVLTDLNLEANRLCGVWYGFGVLQGTYNASGVKALAYALKSGSVLTNLNLARNYIDPDLGIAMADALKSDSSVLTNLNLGNNFIGVEGAKALAASLAVNGVLTDLNLAENYIGPELGIAMAEALKVNDVLTELNLRSNNLDAEAGKALAASLAVNSVLTDLNLASNKLCGLDILGRGTYDASGIQALASAISVNGFLTKLDVGYNHMDEEAALAIVRAVQPRDIMTSLGLASCKIGPTGAKEIAEYVKGSGVLTDLNLASNKLCGLDILGRGTYDASGIQALASAISVNGFLTKLDVGDNDINEEAALAIVRAVQPRDIMMSLGLASCKIGPTGAKEIAEYVKGSGVLTNLNLASNNLASGDDMSGILALADALKDSSVMKTITFDGEALPVKQLKGTEPVVTLDLSRKRLGWMSAFVVAKLIEFNGALTSLNLSINRVDNRAEALAANLAGNGVLTNLDLSGNWIRSGFVEALADALSVNSVLTSLNVGFNALGTEGGKALADALSVNRVLKSLNVVGAKAINDEAAQQLAAAALSSASLEVLSEVPIKELREDKHTSLDLSSKNLGLTEGIVIAELTKVSGVLTALDLSSNLLDDRAGNALADALSVNSVLTSLDLSGNMLCGIDEDGDGEYDVSGIQALALAVSVNGVLTNLNLASNNLTNFGEDMSSILAVADALKSGSSVLKKCDMRFNSLDAAAKQMLRDAVKGRESFELLV